MNNCIVEWVQGDESFVLFGAGKGLRDFIKSFPNINIKYAVDNDKSKWGKSIDGIEIKDPEEIKNDNVHHKRIIVTSSYYKEIKVQLENMKLKENIDFINGLVKIEYVENKPVKVNENDSIVNQLIGSHDIKFLCPNVICKNRVKTLFTKEPETINWINGFEDNSVFWDIGANIGIYTLYASVLRSSHTLAFEPAFSNYYVLNRNIELNNLESRVRAFCMAFDDRPFLGSLNMTNTEMGGALHDFGNDKMKTSVAGENFSVNYRQGMIGLYIDYNVPIKQDTIL